MALRFLRVLPLLALLLAGCTPKIGNKCSLSTDCSQLGDRLCDTNQPDGYCTIFNCEPDQCPDSVCVAFDPTLDPACGVTTDGRWPRFERSFCLAPCSDDSDCRAQYTCVDLSDPTNVTLRKAQVVDQVGTNGHKVCMASTCGDGIKDGAETDVDCGGSCLACTNGKHCNAGSDCASGNCLGGICLGSQACTTHAECSSGLCNNLDPVKGCLPGATCTCAGTNCTDKKRDGAETDVDCGGPDCARCVSTEKEPPLQCTLASDCASNLCVIQQDYEAGTLGLCPPGSSLGGCVCAWGDCTNGKWDFDPMAKFPSPPGTETDIDCGGGGCPACPLGKGCQADSDCISSTCISGKCAAPPVCSVPDAGAPWTPYDAGL